MTEIARFPERIGFAADLMIPAVTIKSDRPVFLDGYIQRLIHLGDMLLLHDTILIRSDVWSLLPLYTSFSVDELAPLFRDGRIKFFAATSSFDRAIPILSTNNSMDRQVYFSDLFEELKKAIEKPYGVNVQAIVSQIEANFIESQVRTQDQREIYFQNMMNIFFNCELLKQLNSEVAYDYQLGFETALSKIIDIWATGTYSVYFDPEIISLFNVIGTPPNNFSTATPTFQIVDNQVLDNLHSIRNLPSVWKLLWTKAWDKDKLFRVVTSDNAAYLREWLKSNAEPGIDVRESYFGTLQKLPSKQYWTNWLRFSAQTGLTTAIGLGLTGEPVLSSAIGIMVGATDLLFGEQAVSKALDPYHPREWLEFIERKSS